MEDIDMRRKTIRTLGDLCSTNSGGFHIAHYIFPVSDYRQLGQ